MTTKRKSTDTDSIQSDSTPLVNDDDQSKKKKGSTLHEFWRTKLGPVLIMLASPTTALLAYIITINYHGSILEFVTNFNSSELLRVFPRPSLEAAKIIMIWIIFEIVLLAVLPGKKYTGPVSEGGKEAVYKENGVLSFFVTHIVWFALYFQYPELSQYIFSRYGEILSTLTPGAFIFVIFLFIKGHLFPENNTIDCKPCGNIIWDFYWGVELYPTLFGLSLKQIVNCRTAMMGWSILLNLFLCYQYETLGYISNALLVSCLLQQIYIYKFFVWETGYFASIDIIHDRFGFEICWGCLAFLPSIYPYVAFFLTVFPRNLTDFNAFFIFSAGIFWIFVNYDTDRQRKDFRDSDGKNKVWGSTPKFCIGQYTTRDGRKHHNKLLISGYWGIVRHPNYIPEILLCFFWSSPAGFQYFLPYLYVVFIIWLLSDRAYRDDLRCARKYGKDWIPYQQRVPYRMIPYIY